MFVNRLDRFLIKFSSTYYEFRIEVWKFCHYRFRFPAHLKKFTRNNVLQNDSYFIIMKSSNLLDKYRCKEHLFPFLRICRVLTAHSKASVLVHFGIFEFPALSYFLLLRINSIGNLKFLLCHVLRLILPDTHLPPYRRVVVLHCWV